METVPMANNPTQYVKIFVNGYNNADVSLLKLNT